ncbi:MAG: hypothetical protein JWN53_2357 [Gemmatimonadetes bacterium]|jgi:hypothetical protein|nr:hypothetical protein [Gemmatimonadota bacterium]
MQSGGAPSTPRRADPATRVVIRAIVYYAVLIGLTTLAWRLMPHGGAVAPASLDALFGGGPPVNSKGVATIPLDEVTLAITVGVAMLAAILLALPVAWVYLVTRAKRGYQQSVVQLLIILPAVVAGIVLLVKYSLALAFSLAGIVAAVRFRNTLDDSKDAVYVFLATAIGLSSAVNLPVAVVISIGFNALVLVLWYTDFGSAPMELDGRIADRRLKRARQMARTGTFVARIDDEVFRDMTRDQLEGVAQRAWKRANATDGDPAVPGEEVRLRLLTNNVDALRAALEPRLTEHTKDFRAGPVSSQGTAEVVEYIVQLKKRSTPDDLASLVRAAAAPHLLDVQLS